ncbi:hypothetical protein PVAND_011321 [Polypedilum vanderplanki]|uniref:Uncharacterized protein n=1 Tax=Polypedilum vanderplanki TaxID=319348 RepID=A0A9J6CIX7_POLVA|nr:hypothetical protein PVAND_011321 [Polypedilum vanderplanki]
MNFIKKVLIYVLLLVFDVKTIVNQAEKLESCVGKVSSTLLDSNEENSNLLALIDQSTVILKAFCSENLINIVDKDYDEDVNNDDNYVNIESSRKSLKNNEEEESGGKSYDTSNNIAIDNEPDGIYSDDYFYKTSDDRKLKTLMTFSPLTVYKGVHLLRQLELYNNQEFFQVKGQLNATLELENQQRELYQQKCYSNSKFNIQGQLLNENHLIEKQIRKLLPGQLLIFAKLDTSNFSQRNRLIVKTNGVVRWKPQVENFVWNNLGWSSWSDWSVCSKDCSKGIQQRYRQCLTNQQNRTERNTNKMDSFMSATNARQSQHLCNGYNIEQRQCNLFECKDAVNLLSLTSNITMSTARMSLSETAENINQVVDKNDFTIMLTIRSQVNKYHLSEMINQHLMSLQSDSSQSKKHSSLTISLIDSGLKVVQEKDAASEMFSVKFNLFDMHWHQIALSFRSDGLITCYIDCIWDSSFVMAKGSFEVPSNTRIEMNSKLNSLIEWKQLNIISGNHERSQCSNERTPIYDNNKLFERMFNDEAN